jgi:hypothetical protein
MTVRRDRHPKKQFWQILVTDEGRQIDESDEQLPNVQGPILDSLDPGSNVTVASDRHTLKQFS